MIYKDGKAIQKIYHGTTPIQVLKKGADKLLFGNFRAPLSIEFATQAVIPLTINSKPTIFNAKQILAELKGNSVVVNQQIENGEFSSTTGWSTNGANFSVNNSIATMTATAQWGRLGKQVNAINGHKYVLQARIKLPSANYGLYIGVGAYNYYTNQGVWKDLSTINDTNWHIVNAFGTFSIYGQSSYAIIMDANESGFQGVEIDYIQLIDITQAFPTNTPTSVDDPRVQFVIKYLQDHPEYNTGSIIDSKLLKVVSKGANIWDEEWEIGDFNATTGAKTSGSRVINKNLIKLSNFTYYVNPYKVITIYYYDKNLNYLGYNNPDSQGLFIPIKNSYYCNFRCGSDYGTTYNHDICINISNASLNGTYLPHIADKEYPVSVPNLKSAGSVQDTTEEVKTKEVDLSTLQWTQGSSSTSGMTYFETSISDMSDGNTGIPSSVHITCEKYLLATGNTYPTTTNYGVFVVTSNFITIYTETSPTGKMVYALATPTAQSSVTLPKNIEVQKGGSIECQYDSNAPTPSDVKLQFAINK